MNVTRERQGPTCPGVTESEPSKPNSDRQSTGDERHPPGIGSGLQDYGGRLFPQHVDQLRASGIDAAVARERGYVSVDTKATLVRYGFSPAQQRPPGLLIPVHGVDGQVVGYEYRPDEPRTGPDGKVIKYEKPKGSHNRLDVHPRVQAVLRDPAVTLFVSEGAKKCDAAVSVGIACVGIAGVWGWRGTDPVTGRKTVLGDFEAVAMNGREVVVAFDSDVMTKPQVRQALDRLSQFFTSREARVRYCLLPLDRGEKVGLDDYLAACHTRADLEERVVDELPRLAAATGAEASPARDHPESRATAQPLLVDPPALAFESRILDRFSDQVRLRGLVGEERNAAVLYLALTSRVLDKPVSVGLKGHSSSGKSFTVETAIEFFPDDAVIVFTAMSQRALVYSKRDFQHRTLVVYEATGLREGAEDDLRATWCEVFSRRGVSPTRSR